MSGTELIPGMTEVIDHIKKLEAENKKASVVLDQSYEVNALAQKTIEDLAKKVKNLEINEKVREEKLQELTLMTKHLYDEQGARDCFNLVDQADLEELKAENKKLKAELEEKEEEVSLINSEEMENEEDIAKLKAENKKLKEERDFFHEEVHKTLQHQADDSEQYEKEIKSLKDQVFHEHTKDEIKEIYRVSMELKEENKKLKQENKDQELTQLLTLKTLDDLKEENEKQEDVIEKLQEVTLENKALNKELEYEADTSFADLNEEIANLKEDFEGYLELKEENAKQEDVIKKLCETIRELLPNDPHEADKYIDIAYGEDPH